MGFGKELLSLTYLVRAYKEAHHVKPHIQGETKKTRLASIKTKLASKFRKKRLTAESVATRKQDSFDHEQAAPLNVPAQPVKTSSSPQASLRGQNSFQPPIAISLDKADSVEYEPLYYNQATSSDVLTYPSTSPDDYEVVDIIYPSIAELSATGSTPRTPSVIINPEQSPKDRASFDSRHTETTIHSGIITHKENAKLHQRDEDLAAGQALSPEKSGFQYLSQPNGLFSSVVVLLPKVNTADTNIPLGPDCLPPRISTPPPEPPLVIDHLLDNLLPIAKGQDSTEVASHKSEPKVDPIFFSYCSAPLVALTTIRPSLNQQFEKLFNCSESTTASTPRAEVDESKDTNNAPPLPPPARTHSQQQSGSSLRQLENELRESKAEIERLRAHILCCTLERWDALQDREHAYHQISALQNEVHRLNVQANFDEILLEDGLFGPALQAVRDESAAFDSVLITDGLFGEPLRQLRDENSALRRQHEVDTDLLGGALYGDELDEFRREVALCYEHLENEQRENEALRAELRNLQAHNDVLGESLAANENSVARLMKQGNNARSRAQALQTERDSVPIQLSQTQRELVETRKELSATKARVKFGSTIDTKKPGDGVLREEEKEHLDTASVVEAVVTRYVNRSEDIEAFPYIV
ncbi:hypothetical protein LTR70_005996 [Exophiala xenobiotica]|uniref:Uncharacterized protein n=1 Tax=Lithohypha guttulata TaxID=1690604 RepID=A0ABR0KBD8_9EURO|nr:hypothetical protein LTR24_004811 [Lithohypha guttulata]KAK5316965.1 hypothetical protein LTR70_005996 [Exophiala xenobiotica]